MNDDSVLLEVKNLRVHFQVRRGIVRALEGVNFTIHRGRTLGIIGESGSGKSVTARAIMQLLAKNGKIVDGQILFHQRQRAQGATASEEIIDITKLHPDGDKIRSLRGGEIAMIFQEPMSSLTPVYTAGVHIGEAVMLHLTPFKKVTTQMEEAIRAHRNVTKEEAREIAVQMLAKVGIPRPGQRVDSYPHQLSGGQRQRVMIAIALSCNPSLLIADEPTTALDVTTQAQINDLMRDLQAEFGMAIMYITHDLGVIAEMAKDVAVMYLGRIVESGSVDDIFYNPKHPYTRALLRSIPKIGKVRGGRLEAIRGMVPDVFSIPTGCPFSDRCPEMIPGLCNRIEPALLTVGNGHQAACLLYDEKVMSEVKHGAAVEAR
ncbi:MAG: dipeptide/oligopeptide/nickel ABC transporter ATP-binding protein [Chloroflexi bacterium]|nr:MAG: dipeptide/oligopeptide/nickel ABC transporter ATP-binding protein [Chloroflexota bacterium]